MMSDVCNVFGDIVCLVVARGGSTSPPRKNVLPILGVPCVERIVITNESLV